MPERFDDDDQGQRQRRIVVPLDGSELAERALNYAIALPAQAVRLVAVLPIDLTAAHKRWAEDALSPWGAWPIDDPEAYLRLMGTPFREQGWEVEVVILEGRKPGPRIVEAAVDSDLIVMSTRGQELIRNLLGSTAEFVVRHAETPTMLVRDALPAPAAVLREVVPLDGSERAEEAIPLATALQRALEADLLLVQVVDPSTSIRTVEELTQEAQAYLDIQATRLLDDPGSVSSDVRVGDPVEQLLAVLRPGDSVVMATHGYSDMKRLLLGSVTAAMVDRSPVPVVLIRAKPGEMAERFTRERAGVRGAREADGTDR